MGEAGNDIIYGSGSDTLFGGSNNDFLDIVKSEAGDHAFAYGGSGNDLMATYGQGDVSFFGEAGNDTVMIESHLGNSTISGGAGTDSIVFENRVWGDVGSIVENAGVQTLHFSDGQTFAISEVEYLVFEDRVEHL
jgi:Ca2+-binding RTX toxin-like protein